MIPIPGMRTDERIEENLGSVNVELSDEEYQKLEEELKKIPIHGYMNDEDIIKGLSSLKKLEANLTK